MERKAIHLPGLNGLRAIAALGVVISHVLLNKPMFHLGEKSSLDIAGFGVSIFFALSGFLITYLLLIEEEGQPIDIRKFYVRRILRIWPLYYLYFFIALAVIYFSGASISAGTILLYIFYAANVPFILGITPLGLSHYWSLGVEEQFYIFWPLFVKKLHRQLLWLLPILIAIIIAVKLFLHIRYPLGSIAETAISVSRFHCMMIGGLGAAIYKKDLKRIIALVDNKIVQTICWVVLGLIICNVFHIASVIDNEIVAVLTVVVIIGQINVKNRIINLENRICDFLGKISYGIYVIHPLIIVFLAKTLAPIATDQTVKTAIVFASTLLLTIGTAYLSYTYFERFFLKLKERFMVVKSSASRHE